MNYRENVTKGLKQFKADFKPFCGNDSDWARVDDAITLLKDGENTLGTCITANGITFTATGTAKEGEERGIMLGKAFMHEWLYKELLRKGLVMDDIRSVFIQAKRII